MTTNLQSGFEVSTPINVGDKPDQADTHAVNLDTRRLDWMEADSEQHLLVVGKSWYTRAGYMQPYRKCKSLREAIDMTMLSGKGGAA